MPVVWDIYSDYLWFIHHAYGVKIHSFVLMNNHFHLIASFPEANLSQAMNYFMRETSRVLGFESKRINHVYGGRIFRSRIGSLHYYEHAYKYVYRNPVEANVCQLVESYEYSTLRGLIGLQALTIPVEEDTLLFAPGQFAAHLTWLNSLPEAEATHVVRCALKKAEFKLSKKESTGRAHPLEESRY